MHGCVYIWRVSVYSLGVGRGRLAGCDKRPCRATEPDTFVLIWVVFPDKLFLFKSRCCNMDDDFLSAEDILEIERSLEEISNGKYYADEDVSKMIDSKVE